MKNLIISLTALVFMASSPAPGSEGVTPMLRMDATYKFFFLAK